MALTLTRHNLLTTRIYPTWLPSALETERHSLLTSLFTSTSTSTSTHQHHQYQSSESQKTQKSFKLAGCLQSLFSLQDNILGISNPLSNPFNAFQAHSNFQIQQVRAYSNTSSMNSRAMISAPSSSVMVSAPRMDMDTEEETRGRERETRGRGMNRKGAVVREVGELKKRGRLGMVVRGRKERRERRERWERSERMERLRGMEGRILGVL